MNSGSPSTLVSPLTFFSFFFYNDNLKGKIKKKKKRKEEMVQNK
jgi:hypothetical protein